MLSVNFTHLFTIFEHWDLQKMIRSFKADIRITVYCKTKYTSEFLEADPNKWNYEKIFSIHFRIAKKRGTGVCVIVFVSRLQKMGHLSDLRQAYDNGPKKINWSHNLVKLMSTKTWT